MTEIKNETLNNETGVKNDQDVVRIAAELRAKNPELRLFQITLPDDERVYIGKVGSYKRITQFRELLFSGSDAGEYAISFLQEFIVHPKLDYDEIAYRMPPGHVIAMTKAIQKANGFEDEAELKKL